MNFESGSAFRMSLESRLRTVANESGVPLSRLRKLVAFDRLLVRMVTDDERGEWLVKGGLALQLRMAEGARTTKDIDLLLRDAEADARARLIQAAGDDRGDFFEFEIGKSTPMGGQLGVRIPVVCRLDSRQFETFHVDVGVGDPVVCEPVPLPVTDLLVFAGLEPTVVPCYPIGQHLAEKVHALTFPRIAGQNSRVKDLVDVVLIAGMCTDADDVLFGAIAATFTARATHPMPGQLPDFPNTWASEYRRMAREIGLAHDELAEGIRVARQFVDPVLALDRIHIV